jgi:hypothetical protein
MTDTSFKGFPKEGLQFLADLGKNNNRAGSSIHRNAGL